MPDSVIHALLGKEPGALGPDVSLATPLTLKRLVGRDQVLSALTTYAGVLGATDADLRLHGEEVEGGVVTTTTPGRSQPSTCTVGRGHTWRWSGIGSPRSSPT